MIAIPLLLTAYVLWRLSQAWRASTATGWERAWVAVATGGPSAAVVLAFWAGYGFLRIFI